MKFDNDVVHFTDYSFQKLCEKYGINRGVYNTIDRWFYEKGIIDILARRNEVLNFLKFIASNLGLNRPSKLKFGNGGLVIKLNEFWDHNNFDSKQTYESRSLS